MITKHGASRAKPINDDRLQSALVSELLVHQGRPRRYICEMEQISPRHMSLIGWSERFAPMRKTDLHMSKCLKDYRVWESIGQMYGKKT